MKKQLIALAALFVSTLVLAQTDTENYVKTTTYKNPFTKATKANATDADKVENITYYDGLGRSKQNVFIKGGGKSTATQSNALNYDWEVGNYTTSFFRRIGQDSENNIVVGQTPFNATDLLWECGNDAASDADGGWNTAYFGVDNTQTYRYTVWVKRTGNVTTGRAYHGTQKVNNLDGTPHNNPYFSYHFLPQANTWYLLVGIVHPYTYTGGDTGVSGVYDTAGTKILDGTEFKWDVTTTTSYFRNYLYYCTDVTARQYFWNPLLQKLDGDAYTLQEITTLSEVQYNSSSKDIVTHIDYDAFGRQDKSYLPYATTTNGGAYRNDALDATHTFYDAQKYEADFPGLAPNAINPYSQTAFEASPLNRVLKQAAPGADWKLGSGHEIEFDYQTDTATEVRLYTVSLTADYTPTLVGGTTYYNGGELYKSITKDENHTGASKDHTTEEFKDKQGRVILKRTYNNEIPHDTYYVYDDHGNLTYVLPPKSEPHTAKPDATELSELCYQYKYDYRNRLIEKKIPGKGTATSWESIIYDKLDRPVLTQDALQKPQQKWLFTKYDVFGRVVYTGLYTHGSILTQSEMQAYFSSQNHTAANMYESKVASGSGFSDTYYSNKNFPRTSIEILTVNYYDNYNFNRAGADTSVNSYGVVSTSSLKGLSTGSRVKVLDTNDWITTVSYYDDKARPIYGYSHNAYLQTTDVVKSKLDFTGQVLETTTIHTKDSNTPITTVDRFSYDHAGRLLRQTQEINNRDEELIVKNHYDALGQLEKKDVGGALKKHTDYTNPVGVNIAGATITKTTPNGWNAGLSTAASIAGDGYVSYKINSTYPVVMVGLSYTDTNEHYGTIDYAIYNAGLHVYVYERGTNKGFKVRAIIGDSFSIERRGSTVHYLKNGEVFYTSGVPAIAMPMVGDVSMHYLNRSIENLELVSIENGLQTVDYTYNIRGWLKGINDANNLGDDLFGFGLNYNITTIAGAESLYNGNISETHWQSANDHNKRSYDYNYDALNRITTANYHSNQYLQGTTELEDYALGNVSYDKNGNIISLNRTGLVTANNQIDVIDNLSYFYAPKSNQLSKVNDTASQDGFKNGINTNDDYSYDINGNMVADANKKITSILYNHLNLPTIISFEGLGKQVIYTYDATGVKLSKRVYVPEGGAVRSVSGSAYSGNHIYKIQGVTGTMPIYNPSTGTFTGADYENIDLHFFNQPEGYVQPDNTGDFEYVYQYTDHLGNIRLSYADTDNNGTVDSSEIIEENHFYPFGLKHKGYNNVINGTHHPYGYLNQEENDELGLGWLTFRHRNYMPEIGRFFGVDPVSADYVSISTYQFAHNSPIWKIELEGLEGIPTTEEDLINREPVTSPISRALMDPTVQEHSSKAVASSKKILKASVSVKPKLGMGVSGKANIGPLNAGAEANLITASAGIKFDDNEVVGNINAKVVSGSVEIGFDDKKAKASFDVIDAGLEVKMDENNNLSVTDNSDFKVFKGNAEAGSVALDDEGNFTIGAETKIFKAVEAKASVNFTQLKEAVVNSFQAFASFIQALGRETINEHTP